MLQDGEVVFDSSLSRGEPLTFQLGAGKVIPGKRLSSWKWSIRLGSRTVGYVRGREEKVDHSSLASLWRFLGFSNFSGKDGQIKEQGESFPQTPLLSSPPSWSAFRTVDRPFWKRIKRKAWIANKEKRKWRWASSHGKLRCSAPLLAVDGDGVPWCWRHLHLGGSFWEANWFSSKIWCDSVS